MEKLVAQSFPIKKEAKRCYFPNIRKCGVTAVLKYFEAAGIQWETVIISLLLYGMCFYVFQKKKKKRKMNLTYFKLVLLKTLLLF